MNLTDSCFLQTVSFPRLRDLQAGQRRDLSPKACGHLLHSLLDTLLLLPFFFGPLRIRGVLHGGDAASTESYL